MDTVLFWLLVLGCVCPCFQYLVDGTNPIECPNCADLEQKYVDSVVKVKALEEENQLLKQLSTCHCRDGWIHGNGSCYYMPYQTASWYSARDHCQQLGAHLACITSPKEEAIVADIVTRAHNNSGGYESVSYVWVGGFDTISEGHWHWVTGEPFVYTNWRVTNQNHNDGEDCLDWSYGGWNDNTCSRAYFFICEM